MEEALRGSLLISQGIFGGLGLRHRHDCLEALEVELANLKGQRRFDGFLEKRHLSELGH